MATVFGVLLLVGGLAVLAVVRPWRQTRPARRRARLDRAATGRQTRPDGDTAPARPARARGSVPVARATLTRPNRRTADRQPAGDGPDSTDRRPSPSAGRRDRARADGSDPEAAGDPGGGRDVVVRRHHAEALPRVRRVPSEPGRADIELPHWLGPVSSHRR